MTIDREELRRLCEQAGPGPHEIGDVVDLQKIVPSSSTTRLPGTGQAS